MKIKLIFLFFMIIVLSACSDPTPPPTYPFPSFKWINDPPIKVVINGKTICVPSQHLNPEGELAERTVKNKDGSTKSISPKREVNIELTALLPELNGYTEDFIKNQYKDEKTASYNKSILVKIKLLNGESKYNNRNPSKFRFSTFEEKVEIDQLGFSTRKSTKQKCYAAYTASPTFALEPPKDCQYGQLKFANPAMRDLILTCAPDPGSNRCETTSYLETKDIAYVYSFDFSQLKDFALIHKKIKARINNWLKDESCKTN
jgi:hypothetical protein